MRLHLRRASRLEADHGRARELAAVRMDEPLGVDDATWLAGHLAGCAACRAVAAAYDEQRTLLQAMRAPAPLPPRDLWARTAAAIEGRRARPAPRRRRLVRPARFAFVPVVGLLVVAVAAGSGLLNGVGLFPGQGSPADGSGGPVPTPIAMTAGQVQFVTRGANGVLELSTRRYDQVCPVGAATCGTSGANNTTQLPVDLAGLGSFDAIISPTQDHIVVMGRDATSGGVYVVPVPAAQSPMSTVQPPTPVPTASPTARIAPSAPAATPTASPTARSTQAPRTSATPVPTMTPVPTPSPTPVPTPSPTPTATAVAVVSPSSSPGGTPDANPTPSGSAGPSSDESASPGVEITPAPGGTLEIAHGVIVVGTVSGYSADGTRFAFSARPADGSTGPDVYVWQTGDTEARPVTSDHGSLFASWFGDRLLVSRVTDGVPVTTLIDPVTGVEEPVAADRMWMPTAGPAQLTGVWWDGTVQPSEDGYSWVPADGNLILGAWPDGSDAQVLTTGAVHDWQVRWDDTGTALALWVSDGATGQAGRLSLYLRDPQTGAMNLDRPLLAGVAAYEGFSLRAGRVAWSAPVGETPGDETTIDVLAWSGDTIGHLALPTLRGATVVR